MTLLSRLLYEYAKASVGKKYIAVSVYIEYKEALQTQPIGQGARKLIDGLKIFESEKLWTAVIHSLLEMFPFIRSLDKEIHRLYLSWLTEASSFQVKSDTRILFCTEVTDP